MYLLESIHRFVWGIPAMGLIIAVGIYLTVKTRFLQIRKLPEAIRLFFRKIFHTQADSNSVSSFQALCTALAATVGTGNLAGVAGAIAIGGPGSIFWMWVCALLGMITKYAEVILAVQYRERNAVGEYVGGPMYMIRNGLGRSWQWLAYVYSFCGVVAAFGVGNATQINTVIGGINGAASAFGAQETIIGNLIMGVLLALLTAGILMGGMKRIGNVAEALVPAASVIYLVLCVGLLVLCADKVPEAFRLILKGAFCPRAVTGGAIGSAFQALRVGASRGVFTNEAGMGTASIAHSTADVANAREQGLMGIIEVFIDTIVICTMTGVAILCSGYPITYGMDSGIALTNSAFQYVYGGWVSIVLAVILCCFAIATVIGWGFYGIRCAQFLFGEDSNQWFLLLQFLTVIIASVMRADTVWVIAEIVNGCMCIPNLLALCALSRQLTCRRTKG